MLCEKLCAIVIWIYDGIWAYMSTMMIDMKCVYIYMYDYTWWWISLMEGMVWYDKWKYVWWMYDEYMKVNVQSGNWHDYEHWGMILIIWKYLLSCARHGQGTEVWYNTYRHVQDMDREQNYDMIPIVIYKTWTGNLNLWYLLSCARHGQEPEFMILFYYYSVHAK